VRLFFFFFFPELPALLARSEFEQNFRCVAFFFFLPTPACGCVGCIPSFFVKGSGSGVFGKFPDWEKHLITWPLDFASERPQGAAAPASFFP